MNTNTAINEIFNISFKPKYIFKHNKKYSIIFYLGNLSYSTRNLYFKYNFDWQKNKHIDIFTLIK